MALNLITYEDKVSIKENPAVEKNKGTAKDFNEIKNVINNLIFPVGCIIINSDKEFNPNVSYGGTWEQFAKGKTLIGVDEADSDFNVSEMTGGEKTHTLTNAELPARNIEYFRGGGSAGWPGIIGVANVDGVKTGEVNATNGQGQPHNNLQPYITVYMWKRVA